MKTTHNRFSAEDAAQDAFVAAWLKLNTLTDPSKFGAWVCKAARNRAKSILARYSGWMDISAYENTEADGTFSPETALIDASEKEELHNAIKSLPEKVRTVRTLHYFEGLSVAEIAFLHDKICIYDVLSALFKPPVLNKCNWK